MGAENVLHVEIDEWPDLDTLLPIGYKVRRRS